MIVDGKKKIRQNAAKKNEVLNAKLRSNSV